MITAPVLKALETPRVVELLEAAYFEDRLTEELYLECIRELKTRTDLNDEVYAGLFALGKREWREQI